MESRLPLEIFTQPDDTSCGPTCLHAVYRYFGDSIALGEVLSQTERLDNGGTLAVLLGCHALSRGYRVTIFSYNLLVFDPSWFSPEINLVDKLRQMSHGKPKRRLQAALRAYVRFLEAGGCVRFEDLNSALIRRYLRRAIPILTGLSATYLYRSKREIEMPGGELDYDDIAGSPQGHFVVLGGYDRRQRLVRVADPWGPTQPPRSRQYWVGIDRLLNSILLGVITYDANLLVIEPRRQRSH
jgi:hypothetical protein